MFAKTKRLKLFWSDTPNAKLGPIQQEKHDLFLYLKIFVLFTDVFALCVSTLWVQHQREMKL